MNEKLGPSSDGLKWTGHAYEPVFGMYVGVVTIKCHSPEECMGRPCPIHEPSDHHMKDWRLAYRADRNLMERTCKHGVGHPDPDDVFYHRVILNEEHAGSHGCDGCCRVEGEMRDCSAVVHPN